MCACVVCVCVSYALTAVVWHRWYDLIVFYFQLDTYHSPMHLQHYTYSMSTLNPDTISTPPDSPTPHSLPMSIPFIKHS